MGITPKTAVFHRGPFVVTPLLSGLQGGARPSAGVLATALVGGMGLAAHSLWRPGVPIGLPAIPYGAGIVRGLRGGRGPHPPTLSDEEIAVRLASLYQKRAESPIVLADRALDELCQAIVTTLHPGLEMVSAPDLNKVSPRSAEILAIMLEGLEQSGEDMASPEPDLSHLVTEVIGRTVALACIPHLEEGLELAVIEAEWADEGRRAIWSAILLRLLVEPGRAREVAARIVEQFRPFAPFDDLVIDLTDPDLDRRHTNWFAVLSDPSRAGRYYTLLGSDIANTPADKARMALNIGFYKTIGMDMSERRQAEVDFEYSFARHLLLRGGEDLDRFRIIAAANAKVMRGLFERLTRDVDPTVARRAGEILKGLGKA